MSARSRQASSVAVTLSVRLALTFLGLVAGSGVAHADTWADLWSTHEQQAQKLLDSQHPEAAAPLFSDARRRAYAEMEAGQYAKAAKSLKPFKDADSQYNRGNALAHSGELREALTAYDAALAAAPGDKDVIRNRDLVKRALEQQQNQSGQQGDSNGRSGSQGSKGGQSQGGNHSPGGNQPQPGQSQAGNQSQGSQSNGQSQSGNPSQGNQSQANNPSQSGSQSQGGRNQPGGQSQAANQPQNGNPSPPGSPSQAANQSQNGSQPGAQSGSNQTQSGNQSPGSQSQAANQQQNDRQPQAGARAGGNQPQGANPSQAANAAQSVPQSQPGTTRPGDNPGGEGALAPNGQQTNGSDATTNLNAQNAQQDADAAVRYRQSQQGRPPPPSPSQIIGADGKVQANPDLPPAKPPSEQALALDQWLRSIPDDSAELLRRKFLIEHMLKQQQRNEQ